MLDSIEECALRLRNAESRCAPIAPLTTSYPELTIEMAYRIQSLNAQSRKTEGLTGYKIGLTSKEAQKHFQVFEPDYGHLFATMQVKDNGSISVEKLIQPKIEGELAFIMGRELKGSQITMNDVVGSIESVCGALEIIDSRIENWKIKAADTIADNGSSARYVLGNTRLSIADINLETIGMALSQNQEVMVTASGAAVMGNPLNAIKHLVELLGAQNIGISKGMVILSGSLGGMVTVKKGMSYRAEFLHLGSVNVSFS